MRKYIAILLAGTLIAKNAQAVEWNYDYGEWPLPKKMDTIEDYNRHIKQKKWLTFVGYSLLLGAAVANDRSVRLGRRANNVPMIYHSEPQGSFFILVPDRGQLDNSRRIRANSRAYKQGALVGALAGLVCLSVAYSFRF